MPVNMDLILVFYIFLHEWGEIFHPINKILSLILNFQVNSNVQTRRTPNTNNVVLMTEVAIQTYKSIKKY